MYKKNISSRKNDDLFRSVFKKNIPDTTIPAFQTIDGITQSLIFC